MKRPMLIPMLLISAFLLAGCAQKTYTPASPVSSHAKGIITYGTNGVYRIDVKKYTRVSSGWIVITSDDGRVFKTDERNVLIIESWNDEEAKIMEVQDAD